MHGSLLVGVVVSDRRLGKSLRFIEIREISENLSDNNDGDESKPVAGFGQVKLKCSYGSHFEGSFPSHRKSVKMGDILRVKVLYVEEVQPINGMTSKTSLLHVSRLEVLKHTTVQKDNKSSVSYIPEATSATPLPGLCKSWIYAGKCALADADMCPYRHYFFSVQDEDRSARLRRKRLLVQESEAQSLLCYHGKQDKSHHQDKSKRATVFVKWLLDTFGRDCFARESCVLDVAGGKGLLSIKLLLETGSRTLMTTVIDPKNRKTLMSKHHIKLLTKHGCNPPSFLQEPFDVTMLQNEKYRELLGTCNLIVGMHPDQATGAIVEVALSLRKPFAVVPCCVFAEEFPQRRTKTGKYVKTLNELIDWILSKNKNIRTDYLPIVGRNKVLYMTPEDFP